MKSIMKSIGACGVVICLVGVAVLVWLLFVNIENVIVSGDWSYFGAVVGGCLLVIISLCMLNDGEDECSIEL